MYKSFSIYLNYFVFSYQINIMVSLDRIRTKANICSVEIAFNGISVPSALEGWQPFYNSTFPDVHFYKKYATISSLDFAEESIESNAGTSYRQKVIFRFPSNDKNRSERIVLLKKTKFVKLNLTQGQSIVIGRNDFTQNTAPKIGIKTNHHFCEITIESTSIFPSGFTASDDTYGLPSFIPIEL